MCFWFQQSSNVEGDAFVKYHKNLKRFLMNEVLMALGSRLSWWFYAARAARKHIKNYWLLLLLSILRSRGIFRAMDGSMSSPVDAQRLLRFLTRLERWWPWRPDYLRISFRGSFIEVPLAPTFPRTLKIPLNSSENFLRRNPFICVKKYMKVPVQDLTVLDIGAYIGDTPLFWFFKGAKEVYAVEPVPEHFNLLKVNCQGLPVVFINAVIGKPIPYIPELIGSGKYGRHGFEELSSFKDIKIEGSPLAMLNVPVLDLLDLVSKYTPDVVKINCEGCEYYVLDEITELPKLGVKILVVELHDVKDKIKEEGLHYLETRLGRGNIISKSKRDLTSLWRFKNF